MNKVRVTPYHGDNGADVEGLVERPWQRRLKLFRFYLLGNSADKANIMRRREYRKETEEILSFSL
jgi:hypothetical protein